ncbi:hypothetical protein TNIN_295181, partial [Trichonephila inaurata madagascariensis]
FPQTRFSCAEEIPKKTYRFDFDAPAETPCVSLSISLFVCGWMCFNSGNERKRYGEEEPHECESLDLRDKDSFFFPWGVGSYSLSRPHCHKSVDEEKSWRFD